MIVIGYIRPTFFLAPFILFLVSRFLMMLPYKKSNNLIITLNLSKEMPRRLFLPVTIGGRPSRVFVDDVSKVYKWKRKAHPHLPCDFDDDTNECRLRGGPLSEVGEERQGLKMKEKPQLMI
jgi:hypothetical protein